MRLGIDFGTTRIVVAAADRGNFPLVHFETPDGQACDWYPPVVAVRGDERLYGWQALAVQDDEELDDSALAQARSAQALAPRPNCASAAGICRCGDCSPK